MEHIYRDPLIQSYFAVQSLQPYGGNMVSGEPHRWFSMLLLPQGGSQVFIDNTCVECKQPTVLFITPGQYVQLTENTTTNGFLISFNREFYCIEIHDNEVSCNGLLFVNNHALVNIALDEQQLMVYLNTVKEIITEFEQNDDLLPEMLKTLLKNLLIRSSRLFRQQNLGSSATDTEMDFYRKFNKLVDANFLTLKQVEDYARLLGISASSLTKKMQNYGIDSPSRLIKNRIITEAKRLLMYTDKPVKEIAFNLGYDDQHYFSRFFTRETGISPTDYKKQVSRV